MFDILRLRQRDQRTIAVLMAVIVLLLCWNSIDETEVLKPKTYRFRIDINTATLGELQVLPGIGPKLAERIVQYRDSAAPITHYEKILNVNGIGRKKLETIKPYFTE
jgi:competence ComEA-like helix-hairpin-helix protein